MAQRRRSPAAPKSPSRVALYIRVSALMGRGGDDFHSPELQEAAVRRLVKPLGADVVAVVQDIDVSGRSFSREGIDTITAMVERGEIDAVAVADLSRLGRNVLGSLQFIGWLRDHDVTVLSAREHIDDSPTGRLLLTVILGIAQMISEQIGAQWSAAIEERTRKGIQHGHAPLGYRKEGKRLVVTQPLGMAVVDVFRRYAEGWPISEIAERLSRIRSKGTALAVVKAMLRNPVYLGKVTKGGEVVGDGLHEPLVDQETWDTVQLRLARDARTPPRSLDPSHSLVGLVECAECGRKMKRNDEYDRANGGVRHRRMMCGYSVRYYGAGKCAGGGTPTVDELEARVLDAVQRRLSELRTDHVARAQQQAGRARASADLRRLERELTRTRDALARLTTAWAKGEIPDSGYRGAAKELEEAERLLAGQIDEIQPAAAVAPAKGLIAAMQTLLRLWPDATDAERNRMLRPVVVRVTVRRPAYRREPVADRATVELR